MGRGISARDFDAVIFDLDGVVTDTARTHACAWKKTFDAYLEGRSGGEASFQPFDVSTDYPRYVDGKPRLDGVRDFLESRGIELPPGSPDDPPGRETVCGLGNRKNRLFRQALREEGVEVYETSVQLIRALRSEGVKTAVVSSSRNAAAVLEAADIAGLFDAKVDGVDAEQMGLEGKPSPDLFLEAAHRIGVAPERAVVVEDAVAGVSAGRKGGFGLVVGVDRAGQAGSLREQGADFVVEDLGSLRLRAAAPRVSRTDALPSALEEAGEIARQAEGKEVAVFLDYDGTLTPIVDRPEQAVLDPAMKSVLQALSKQCVVAVVSGRDLGDVRERVGIEELFYAGSHGFDIAGPKGLDLENQEGADFLPLLDRAEEMLRDLLEGVPGAHVERKKYSVATHFRNVADENVDRVKEAVERARGEHPELRRSLGKKVIELQPGIDWDKGRAVLWLLDVLKLDRHRAFPLYMGDDVTDEDAFRVLEDRGAGIVVEKESRDTRARYVLQDPEEVRAFLEDWTGRLRGRSEA